MVRVSPCSAPPRLALIVSGCPDRRVNCPRQLPRTHNIEHTRRKAEQKENRQPPRRSAEPPIDEPAETGADHNTCNEFAGEPKAPGVAGCSCRPIRFRTRRRVGTAYLAKTFVEPLKPRGESSLVGVLLVPVAVFACVAHGPNSRSRDIRGLQHRRHARTLKPRGPYLLVLAKSRTGDSSQSFEISTRFVCAQDFWRRHFAASHVRYQVTQTF